MATALRYGYTVKVWEGMVFLLETFAIGNDPILTKKFVSEMDDLGAKLHAEMVQCRQLFKDGVANDFYLQRRKLLLFTETLPQTHSALFLTLEQLDKYISVSWLMNSNGAISEDDVLTRVSNTARKISEKLLNMGGVILKDSFKELAEDIDIPSASIHKKIEHYLYMVNRNMFWKTQRRAERSEKVRVALHVACTRLYEDIYRPISKRLGKQPVKPDLLENMNYWKLGLYMVSMFDDIVSRGKEANEKHLLNDGLYGRYLVFAKNILLKGMRSATNQARQKLLDVTQQNDPVERT